MQLHETHQAAHISGPALWPMRTAASSSVNDTGTPNDIRCSAVTPRFAK